MKNTTILITGSTGFIGGLIVNKLLSLNVEQGYNISLILPVRNLVKAHEKFSPKEFKHKNITFIESSLEDLSIYKIPMEIHYIFHCASITSSSLMISNPVEVVDGIVIGTKNILEISREKQIKSMVYLSSIEVYGEVANENILVSEDILGDLNIFSARSCYPLGKRMAEHYCYSYYKEYNVPVKIARLAQVFGQGVDKNDNRVFAQFIKAVCENRDIVLHTNGESIGNYCESDDAIRALFTILIKGKDGEAYNVVNETNTMRIKDMADLVANEVARGKIKVTYDIPLDNKFGFAEPTRLRLSSQKLRKLGWKPTKDLKTMYYDLYKEMGGIYNNRGL